MNKDYETLKLLVKELFDYLEYTEESDSGKIFNPIQISCCRVMLMDKVDKCIHNIKKQIGD